MGHSFCCSSGPGRTYQYADPSSHQMWSGKRAKTSTKAPHTVPYGVAATAMRIRRGEGQRVYPTSGISSRCCTRQTSTGSRIGRGTGQVFSVHWRWHRGISVCTAVQSFVTGWLSITILIGCLVSSNSMPSSLMTRYLVRMRRRSCTSK
jgi:hypothetical protein